MLETSNFVLNSAEINYIKSKLYFVYSIFDEKKKRFKNVDKIIIIIVNRMKVKASFKF